MNRLHSVPDRFSKTKLRLKPHPILLLLFCLFLLAKQAPASSAQSPATIPLPANAVYLPIIYGPPAPRIIIAAAHIDSVLSGEPDEAILLWNVGSDTQKLAGWQIASGTRKASFPITSTLTLAVGQRLWCTAQATLFRTTFLDQPSCEWAIDSDPSIDNLDGKLGFTNSGGAIQLFEPGGKLIDTLLYGNESQPAQGWIGAPAQAYVRGGLSASGQVWQRKLDSLTWQPIDRDNASDWTGDLNDPTWGRRVRMPGWGGWTAAERGLPISVTTTTANVTVLVGPEGLYGPLSALLASAQQTIDMSIYTLEHPEAAQVLAEAARRGVKIRIILEGSPPGGIDPVQKWCVAQVAAAGADVRYLAVREDVPKGYTVRYRYIHTKYILIDGRLALVGTDNFNYDSMPVEQGKPVGGRRGFYLVTDAPGVVAALQQIYAVDWNPQRFLDLHPFDPAHAQYGGPPANFVLPQQPIYFIKESPYRQPVTVRGSSQFAVVSSPENSLRPDAGMLGLISRARAGDEIRLLQLYEHKHWGESASSPIADPNPRLQSVIDAARRGAKVRILLDSYFDSPTELRSNAKTVAYVNAIAASEGLDMQARVGNPTRGGIHAKVVLINVGGETWSAVGSLNGSEISHKLNREVVLLVDLAGVYARLVEVFEGDWLIP